MNYKHIPVSEEFHKYVKVRSAESNHNSMEGYLKELTGFNLHYGKSD